MRETFGATMLVIAAFLPFSARAQSEEISFDELWAYATRHSPQLQVAISQRAHAQAARAQQRGVLAENPTLTVEGGPRFQGRGRSYDLAAGISQPVRVGGERHAERRLAQTASERIEAEIRQAEWQLRQDLRAVYRRAGAARAHAELAAMALAFQERVLRLVTSQVAAGDASPLKLRLAEIEALQAGQGAIAAEQALQEARLELALLAGVPASSPPLARSTLELAELSPAEEMARKASHSAPIFGTLRARLQQAQAYSEVEDRKRFVQPEIGAAYVREGSTPAAGPVSHSAIATLSLPLPLWFRNQGARAEARAESTVAEATLRAQQSTLDAEVTRLRSRVEAEERRLALYNEGLLPRVAEHLALIEKALAMGEMDIFDVATFRARTLDAQRDALQTRVAYVDALSELERLLGYELPVRTAVGETP